MEPKKWKLSYKIGDRRPLLVRGQSNNGPSIPDRMVEMVHVEWRHEDGFPPDTREIAFRFSQINQIVGPLLDYLVSKQIIDSDKAMEIEKIVPVVFKPHPLQSDLGLLTVIEGTRDVLVDQINVSEGTPTEALVMILEDKRQALAKSLGIEP